MTHLLNQKENSILELAIPHLYPGDNEKHTLDALDFALRLLELVNGVRDVVVPAIVLHDVGWSKVPDDIMKKSRIPGRDLKYVKVHEKEGAKIAGNILKKVQYDVNRIDEILEIINGHDTRDESISLNDEIVKDSDKLSRYSTLFNQVLAWSGIEPKSLHDDLELRIDEWFFLAASEEIATEELQKRRKEFFIK